MIDRKAPRSRLSEWSRRLKEAFAFSEAGVLAALILFFTVMYLLSPAFRTQYNMTSILKQISTTATIAMGQTLVIISGAFDLSQGPVAGLAAMLTAISWQHWGLPVPLAICFGLGVGIACGLANGLLAARFRLHPMVMTLATATVFTGLNYFITRGYPVTRLPEGLKWLGRGQIGPFPVPILVMLLVSAIMHLMLVRTLYGRRVLQVGGNLEAARAVGIRVERAVPPDGEGGRSREYLALRVEDEGEGIPAENLKFVFDPFFTTKDVGEGTGLGLSISYGIVQEHHGWIDVESEVGRGSRFTIYLPMEEGECADES